MSVQSNSFKINEEKMNCSENDVGTPSYSFGGRKIGFCLFSFFFINLFIYLWLCWVFVAVCGLSLVAVSGGLLFVGV